MSFDELNVFSGRLDRFDWKLLGKKEILIPYNSNRSLAGKDLDLQIGPRRLAFTPETFILSFSLPNLHFHAVTAYDILRTRGVPLGKRDYEGRLRTRPG